MHIRRAVSEDAPLLAVLNRQVHDLHVAAEPEVYRDPDPSELVAWFRERMRNGDMALIAHDEEPLGYLMARTIDRPGHLFAHPRRFLLVDQVAVHTTFRRRGVGRALMAAAEDLAQERGLDMVELDVRAINHDALSFYATLGYQPDSLHLRRRIAPP